MPLVINGGYLIAHLEPAIRLVPGPRLILGLEPMLGPVPKETNLDISI